MLGEMSPPEKLLCTICQDICKRASKIPCCGAQCCWGCGVRSITRSRKCWNCPNIAVVTEDLVKDIELREDINKYNQATRKDEVLSSEGRKPSVTLESTGATEKCSESLEMKISPLNQIMKNDSKSDSEEVAVNISKKQDGNYFDKRGEVTTHDEVFPEDFHQNNRVNPAHEVNIEDLVDNHTVVKELGKEVDPPIENEFKDNFDVEHEAVDVTKLENIVALAPLPESEEFVLEDMNIETADDMIDSLDTVPMNMGVSLAKMKERNSEFERCMSPDEKACSELKFGAQLELLLKFTADHARCLMCGKLLASEFLILKHIQLKHKVEYGQLRTVLQITNMKTLNMLVHKAIRAEFSYQQKQIFPIPVV